LSSDQLSFREEDHTYWRGEPDVGVRLRSITQMLGIAGLVNTQFFTPQSATRGTSVHSLTEHYDSGALDEAQVEDDPLYPYLVGWKKFVDECGAEFSRIEWMLSDPDIGVAGTIDRVGTMTLDDVRCHVVLDIKSGRAAPSHRIQLQGYQELVERAMHERGESVDAPLQRVAVYITKRGTYKVVRFNDEGDAAVWAAVVKVVRFRETHHLL
jgi:hypothetical protein